jgi:hypothetical protein
MMSDSIHYCTLIRVERGNSILTTYYLDVDHGGDLAAALNRMRDLAEAGKSSWVEPFYGQRTKLDYRRYVEIERPAEEEVTEPRSKGR